MLDESSTLNVKLSIATLFSSIFVIISKASKFDNPGITISSPLSSYVILFFVRSKRKSSLDNSKFLLFSRA